MFPRNQFKSFSQFLFGVSVLPLLLTVLLILLSFSSLNFHSLSNSTISKFSIFTNFQIQVEARNSINGLPDSNLVCKNSSATDCGFVQKSDNIAVLASNVAQVITYIIGSVAIVFILYGAFIWMTGGDKGPENGKKMITNALIALIIATAAYGIVATIISFLNTTTVGGDGNSQTQNPTNQNNTVTNTQNNQNNQTTNNNSNINQNQTRPKAENPINNQPIQNNNPQNNTNTQTKPAEIPAVETPKSQNNPNQTNQSLLQDFDTPVITPPMAPGPNK